MKSKEAKKILTDLGYYTGSLWSIEDVTDHYKCTDEEAFEVLEMALTNSYIKSEIMEAIKIASEQLNLERL